MRKTTKVLSIGLEEWRNAVRKALPHRRKNGYWGVNNLWDLCALPEVVTADVAVFHHSFPPHDLRYAAEYVRRRWPNAVILVIGEQAKQLDDPLYDHKTSSEISTDELVSVIEKAVAAKKENQKKGVGGNEEIPSGWHASPCRAAWLLTPFAGWLHDLNGKSRRGAAGRQGAGGTET